MAGKPRGDVARDVIVTMRLTPQEADAWRARAASLNGSVSDWIRALAARDVARNAKTLNRTTKGKR